MLAYCHTVAIVASNHDNCQPWDLIATIAMIAGNFVATKVLGLAGSYSFWFVRMSERMYSSAFLNGKNSFVCRLPVLSQKCLIRSPAHQICTRTALATHTTHRYVSPQTLLYQYHVYGR